MDAYQFGAGADDDGTGSCPVLWRAGAEEKCAGHDGAKLRHDGCHHDALGDGQLQSRVRIGEQLYRRAPPFISARSGGAARCRLRCHHTAADLHGLPTDVCHHHAGPDYGCLRGTNEVQRHAAVHGAVVSDCLQSNGAHGVGQGWAVECFAGRKISLSRFRGWDGGARDFWRLGAGVRAVSRKARGLSEGVDDAAQCGTEFCGRVFAVGGLVWI